MTSTQRLAVLVLSVFSALAIVQQTAPTDPPPANSQTTTTTTTTNPPSAQTAPTNSPSVSSQTTTNPVEDLIVAPVPMTKKEMKDQRRRQKLQEKAADAHVKAQKDNADALKQENKSTDATEKANAPQ